MNDLQLEIIMKKERLGILNPKIKKIIDLLMEIEDLVLDYITKDDI